MTNTTNHSRVNVNPTTTNSTAPGRPTPSLPTVNAPMQRALNAKTRVFKGQQIKPFVRGGN